MLLRFVGALQRDDSEAVDALEVIVRGRHTELDPGTAKAASATAFKVKTALSYYRLELNGEVLEGRRQVARRALRRRGQALVR